jgi:D-glycero-D-manno-heptose 1,7-bisphosphate phosphatase
VAASNVKPALFCDRDGVINEGRSYVHRTENFHFIDDVFDLCQAAMMAEVLIVVGNN